MSAKRSGRQLDPDTLCSSSSCCAFQSPVYVLVIGKLLLIVLVLGLGYRCYACFSGRKLGKYRCTGNDDYSTTSKKNIPTTALGDCEKHGSVPGHVRRTLQERLRKSFAENIQLFRSLTRHPLGYLAHAEVQKQTVYSFLLSQYARCQDLELSIDRLHSRVFGTYKAWCKRLRKTPRFSRNKLSDIADMMMLYSTSEQLRRVPSFISHQFHQRSKIAEQNSKNSFKRHHEQTGCLLEAVDCYRYNYDDLEDLFLQPKGWSGICPSINNRIWDNLHSPFAFPRSGAWVAMSCDFFYFFKLHLLLYSVVVDVVRSPFQSQWLGFMDFYLHLTSSHGRSTLQKLLLYDCLLIPIEQTLDVFATGTLRLRHVLQVMLSLVCLWFLQFDQTEEYQMLTSLLHLPRLPSAQHTIPLELPLPFSLAYFYCRATQLLWVYLRQLAHLNSFGGFLPGAVHSLRSSRWRAPSCSIIRMGKWLAWGLGYFVRSVGFWLFVFLIKTLFDAYVLWPSVAGITRASLCEPNPWDPIKHSFAMGLACHTFVLVLWIITFIISLATTYVAYVVGLSIFGNVVPHVFAQSSRWEKPWYTLHLSFLMCLVLCLHSDDFQSILASLSGSLRLFLSVGVLLLLHCASDPSFSLYL